MSTSSKEMDMNDDSNLMSINSSSTNSQPRNLARETAAARMRPSDTEYNTDPESTFDEPGEVSINLPTTNPSLSLEDEVKENKETIEQRETGHSLDTEEAVEADTWFMRLPEKYQILLRTALPEGQEWDMNADINASFNLPEERTYSLPGDPMDPHLHLVTHSHTPLTYAIGDNLYDLAAILLANGADPNSQTGANQIGDRYRPLDFLCWHSNAEHVERNQKPLIKLLTRYNADYLLIRDMCYSGYYTDNGRIIDNFLTANDWFANKIRANIFRISFGPITPAEREAIIAGTITINATPIVDIIAGYARPSLEEVLTSTAIATLISVDNINDVMLPRRRPIYMARMAQSFSEEKEEKAAAEQRATLPARLLAAEQQIAALTTENARLRQDIAASNNNPVPMRFDRPATHSSSAIAIAAQRPSVLQFLLKKP